MPSILSTLHSIRTLVEKGQVYGTQEVLKLFHPLLEMIAEQGQKTVEEVLTNALSDHLSKQECQLTPHLYKVMRIDLENKAQSFYSLGSMDALPTDILSHAVSFLSYNDRLPLESVCRFLFAISRNTPVCEAFTFYPNIKSTHIISPYLLSLDSPTTNMIFGYWFIDPSVMELNLNLNRTHGLFLSESKNVNRAIIHWNLPNIHDLYLHGIRIESIIKDDFLGWQFIQHNHKRIRTLSILPKQHSSNISSDQMNELMVRLSHHSNIKKLSLNDFTIPDGFHGASFIPVTLLHLCNCNLTIQSLNSLIHTELIGFVIKNTAVNDGVNPDRSQALANIHTGLSQWSMFQLPKLKELKVECQGNLLTLPGLCDIINNCGDSWMNIEQICLKIHDCRLNELCDLLQKCQVSIPTRFRFTVSIDILKPSNPSSPIYDIAKLLNEGSLSLKMFKLHIKQIEQGAQELFQRNLIQLFELNQSEKLEISIIVGDQNLLDPLHSSGIGTDLLNNIVNWVSIDPDFSIFSL